MWRVWLIFGFILVFYSAIVVRLFYWQVIASDRLQSQATVQYEQRYVVPATRGAIVDTQGSPIVSNQPASLVYARPQDIVNVHTFVDQVSRALDLDAAEVTTQITRPNAQWVPLARKVDNTIIDSLKTLDIDGVGFEAQPKRFYPEASMAAHMLGFVGSDMHGFDTGYFGLEGYYNRELRGKDGTSEFERDSIGAPILLGREKRIIPEDGHNLTLHLDKTVQVIAETHLKNGLERYGARKGTVTIMDPHTGGILAMASLPNYDPTSYGAFPEDVYKNPIVAETYEPGSTFKVLVMAAGIEEEEIDAESTMVEEGPVQIGEYFIRTWNNEYHGEISMTDVLKYSSNVGMVYVANTLGRRRFVPYIRAFGFGSSTGVDLEDEESPELRSDRDWKEIDIATGSFGQGIAVTPLQMVRAVAALASDGWLMEPHVVQSITDEDGTVRNIEPKRVRRVVSKKAADVVTEMMVAAVDEGEAQWAKPKGYRIAGKTGTAQLAVAGHYDEEKTIASFVGFAPADDPMFAMLVTLTEPTSSPWGSETAAPLFFAIASDLLAYYNVPSGL